MRSELPTCTGVFPCESKDGMWREEELKADSGDALTDSAFEYDQIQTHTHKTRGQVCQHAKSCVGSMHGDTRGNGCTVALPIKSRRPPVSVGTPPDPATTSKYIPLLSCSSLLFSVLLCFLLLYGAASSSSDPQEAIHFLIICTSNRGRHRDADHKFSPPPLRCGAIVQQQLPLIGAVGSNC